MPCSSRTLAAMVLHNSLSFAVLIICCLLIFIKWPRLEIKVVSILRFITSAAGWRLGRGHISQIFCRINGPNSRRGLRRFEISSRMKFLPCHIIAVCEPLIAYFIVRCNEGGVAINPPPSLDIHHVISSKLEFQIPLAYQEFQEHPSVQPRDGSRGFRPLPFYSKKLILPLFLENFQTVSCSFVKETWFIIFVSHYSNKVLKLPARFLLFQNLKNMISRYIRFRKCLVGPCC